MEALSRRLGILDATVRSQYGNGAFRYLKLVWYSLLRPNRFVVLAADTAGFVAPPPVEGVEFRWAGPAELERMRAGRTWPREFYMDRWVDPARCCLGFDAGEPAYVHWVFMPGDHSRFLRIHDGAAEINYILTLPGHRGRGVCRAAIAFAVETLERHGVLTIYAVVHDRNVASLKALRRAGMRDVGAVRSIGRLNARFDARPLSAGAHGLASRET